MKSFFKEHSNSISYMIIFGAFMSLLMGFPLGTGAGIAIGAAVGQSQDKKKGE